MPPRSSKNGPYVTESNTFLLRAETVYLLLVFIFRKRLERRIDSLILAISEALDLAVQRSGRNW